MSIRIMLTIVRGFGLIALAATILAGAGALTSDLVGPEETLSGGLRLHIVLGLAAGLLATAAHVFFVFFLPRATIALAAAESRIPGWAATVFFSLLAAALTLAAVLVGVQAMTESFRGDLHRGVALAAVVAQAVALVTQSKASTFIAKAEAEDASS